MNPYEIEGPAVISFSGGRTSGYLLQKVAETGIGRDVHVVFANTGKERPETLDFVRDCAMHFGVDVRWIEYVPPQYKGERGRPFTARFREVTHGTASRNGEPFTALVKHRSYLPNPVTRFCTEELKIRPMKAFMQSLGYEHWINVVGLRADEPRRVAKMKARNDLGKERWDVVMPLARAGVSRSDVRAFWSGAGFDLKLRSWEGNCDLCFMKSRPSRERILQDRPATGEWWAAIEESIQATFQGVREPPVRALIERVRRLPVVSSPTQQDPEDAAIDCFCTD